MRLCAPTLLAILTLTAAAGTASATPPSGVWRGGFDGGYYAMNVSMTVLVDGRPLQTVPHNGRTYLPVREPGGQYEIRVRNHGSRRVLAIVSVDGLSVMDGRTANDSGGGYVIGPYGTIRIKGWRRGNEHVAAFDFTGREESYAHLTGRGSRIGEIRLLAIEEQPLYQHYPPRHIHPFWPYTGSRSGPRGPGLPNASWGGSFRLGAAAGSAGGMHADSSFSAPARSDLGTGYGHELEDRVRTVSFRRGTKRKTIVYHYASAKSLADAGVTDGSVTGFNWRSGHRSFSPPPPGWTGR